MSADSLLAMSVVALVPNDFDEIRPAVAHVQAQAGVENLELIIVTPDPASLEVDAAATAGFGAVQVVEGDPYRSNGQARAEAVRRARAPVVSFVEEHSFPEPGWAQALLRAHAGPWAAVGAAIINANPNSLVSWACLLLDFGSSLDGAAGGETEHPPSHNTSYKRAALLDYGLELESLLGSEENLFRSLRARGCRLYLEPEARVRHINVSLLLPLLQVEYYGGRVFGGQRAHLDRPGGLRRLAHIAGGPAISLARLRYVLRTIERIGRRRELVPRALPVLAAGLLAHGLGESIGWAFGPGNAPERRNPYELDRLRFTRQGEVKPEATQ